MQKMKSIYFCEVSKTLFYHGKTSSICPTREFSKIPSVGYSGSGYSGSDPMKKIVDADEDAISMFKVNPPKFGAVYHCFCGDVETIKRYCDVGVKYFASLLIR